MKRSFVNIIFVRNVGSFIVAMGFYCSAILYDHTVVEFALKNVVGAMSHKRILFVNYTIKGAIPPLMVAFLVFYGSIMVNHEEIL